MSITALRTRIDAFNRRATPIVRPLTTVAAMYIGGLLAQHAYDVARIAVHADPDTCALCGTRLTVDIEPEPDVEFPPEPSKPVDETPAQQVDMDDIEPEPLGSA